MPMIESGLATGTYIMVRQASAGTSRRMLLGLYMTIGSAGVTTDRVSSPESLMVHVFG